MASKGTRLLIGCGLGCAALLVILIAVVGGFFYWMTRPGELLEPERLVGGDTAGFVEWTLREDDPGTQAVVDELLELASRTRREASSPLPPLLQSWLVGMQERRDREHVRELLPLAIAWTARPAPGGDAELHALTLSLKNAGNRLVFFDWILGWIFGRGTDTEKIEHRGEQIYLTGDNRVCFFIHGNDVFIVSDADTARTLVDRLAGVETQGRGVTGFEELFERTPADRALRGAITGDAGTLLRVRQSLGPASGAEASIDELWGAAEGLSVWGGFVGEGDFEASFAIQGPSADWAAERAADFERDVEALIEIPSIPRELNARAEGRAVVVELRISDLAGALEQLLDKHVRAATEPGT